MKFAKKACLMTVLVAICSPSYTNADVITLIPDAGFATGANINALAGPLFSSDLGSTDIVGSGSYLASATKDGNSAFHAAEVELDYSGGPAFFSSTFGAPFERTATIDHRASAESIYFFAVDTPADYFADGFISVIDDAGTTVPGNVELEMELLEFDSFGPGAPAPVTKLYSYQVSKSTIDESFGIGGLEGDDVSIIEGDVVGMLDPSKLYRLRTLVTTNSIDIDGTGPLPSTDGGAIAFGEHSLVITSAIPEPSSALALSLAGTVLLLRRKRSLPK